VDESEATYRLPRTVTPSAYRLTFEPDLGAARFDGAASIDVSVHEPVTEVIVNANELTVHGGSLTAGARTIAIEKVVPDPEAERVTLALAETAGPGAWTLDLTFAGELNDKLVGFYRSVYTDDDGAEHSIATTHFEATDARRAFPCWDEPDVKATFQITLVVDEGLTALANGPEVAREPVGGGRVRVTFAPTMVMSTYLVCMVVGRLVVTEPVDARGVPIRVACSPGKEHLATYALETALYSLNWFGDYYGIPYPDAKLDQVAIPDFAQGAMENLGLVTYRETLLLIDPATATPAELLEVAETVAHELAHMWFGDLVTMRWWNGIWLNEAFATFMSFRCVDAMRPDWRVWDSFARNRANAFEVDALETTRTIEFPVHSPDDASGMFDILTYTKGGAVLRMLEQWLGEDRFRDGIRRYLRIHAHGNTETHDLWDAIEAETGEPVRRVMDAWIFQEGYPAISAALDGGDVVFTQRRFIPSNPDDTTTWPVPLIVRQIHDGGEQVDRVLVEAEGLRLPLASPDAVVVANAGGASFVRAFYDDDLRARLDGRIHELLSPVERQCLVDDAWSAVVAGQAGAGSFIDLVSGFSTEDDPGVWGAIIAGLGWCDRFITGEPRGRLRDVVRDLVRPAFDRLGWDPRHEDTDRDLELRGDLIEALGVLGDDPETQAQAREAESLARGGGDVSPAVAAAAVRVVATTGGASEFDAFAARYREARTPQEEDRYLYALARFRDPALMDRALEMALTDDVRSQNTPFLLAYATFNRDLGPQAFRFITERWDELTSRIAHSNVIALAMGLRYLSDPETVELAQAFFAEHDIPQNHLMLQQLLERQRVVAAMRERVSAELTERFAG
jgi:puromycin-sensitive aminopeptidase